MASRYCMTFIASYFCTDFATRFAPGPQVAQSLFNIITNKCLIYKKDLFNESTFYCVPIGIKCNDVSLIPSVNIYFTIWPVMIFICIIYFNSIFL